MVIPGWAGRYSTTHLLQLDQVYGRLTDTGSAVIHAADLAAGTKRLERWHLTYREAKGTHHPDIAAPLPSAVAPWFRLWALVRMRGNSSSAGLSISYSDLPSGQTGGGLGLFGAGVVIGGVNKV